MFLKSKNHGAGQVDGQLHRLRGECGEVERWRDRRVFLCLFTNFLEVTLIPLTSSTFATDRGGGFYLSTSPPRELALF